MAVELFTEGLFEANIEAYQSAYYHAVNMYHLAEQANTPAGANKQHRRITELYTKMYKDNPGYFDDTPLPGGLLGLHGLNWFDDVKPLLNENCELTRATIPVLTHLMDGHKEKFEQSLIEIADPKRIKICADTRVRFLEFLDRAFVWDFNITVKI